MYYIDVKKILKINIKRKILILKKKSLKTRITELHVAIYTHKKYFRTLHLNAHHGAAIKTPISIINL